MSSPQMKGWMFFCLLGVCGCGSSGSSLQGMFTGLASSAPTGNLSLILSRSPSGALQLLDGPPPAGFRTVAGAQVRLLQSSDSTLSGPDGQVNLAAPEGLQRIWVQAPDGTRMVLVTPVESKAAQAGVRLALFPDRFQLRSNDAVAARAVQVDSQGRYSRVTGSWSQADAPSPIIPPSSSEQLPPLDPVDGTNPPSGSAQERTVGPASGQFEVSAQSGSLSQSADYLGQPVACQASLAGRVSVAGAPIAGAVVQVEGFPQSALTDAQGAYQFQGLAAVPSQVHVYKDQLEIGLGFAPLTSRMLTRLDIPTRPLKYNPGAFLALPQSTGLAVRPSDALEVCDGSSLRLFGVNGQEQAAPPQVSLNRPRGLASDFSGQIYVANQDGDEVARASAPPLSLSVQAPIAVALDGGANLYVLNQGLSFLANSGANSWKPPQALLPNLLLNPSGVAVARDGRIFVADRGHQRVAVLELTQGQPARMLRGDPGNGPVRARLVSEWRVNEPLGIALGPEGAVYVATSHGVDAWTPEGFDPIPVSSGPALGPLSVDSRGRVWVQETDGIHQYLPDLPPVSPQVLPPPTGQTLLSGPAYQALESQFQTAMRDFELPGGMLAISVNGRLLVSRGFGYSRLDLDNQIQTQPDQLFRLASCSKSFTAVATLLQMQDYPARLDLTTRPLRVGGLMGDLLTSGVADSRLTEVEAAHLLRMTAGMNDPTALYAPLARTLGGAHPPATAVETLRFVFANTPLSSQPGSSYVYSDIAYDALGRLVEAVAQAEGLTTRTYESFCQQRFLSGLGISDMRIADTRLGGGAPNEVSYYPFAGEPCSQSVFTNQAEIVPGPYGAIYDGLSHDSAGGWIASGLDLLRFTNALAPDKTPPGFVNPLDSTRRLWMKELPQAANDSAAAYFGAGWNFKADNQGTITSMSKDGALAGTMAWVEYLRQGEDQVIYVFLFNSRPGPGSKKSLDALTQLRSALRAFAAQQAGQWPAGNLWP